jgi:hypothetical protein
MMQHEGALKIADKVIVGNSSPMDAAARNRSAHAAE